MATRPTIPSNQIQSRETKLHTIYFFLPISHIFLLRWALLEHPRFGLIMSIKSLREIKADEEILVNYGMGMADAPMWYKELWVKHLREQKGHDDQQILDWCGRQYAMKGKLVELPL